MSFNLLRYYSLASAVAVVAVTAILVVFYDRYATDNLVTSVEQQNVILASFIGNDLNTRLPQHFKNNIHDAESLATSHHIQHVKDTDALFMDLLTSLPILKVKVYRDDLTIYSTEHSQIGESKSTPGFLIARNQGIPASKLSFRGEFNTFEGVISNRNVIETYVPVGAVETTTGETSRLIVEIYTDVTPLVTVIEQSEVKLIVGLFFLFASLYGVLLLIVRRADRVIDRQYEDLNQEITERKRAEEALRDSEEHLEVAINSISDGFSFYDAEGKLVLCNQIQRDFFPYLGDTYRPGVNREEIIRRHATERHKKDPTFDVEDFLLDEEEVHSDDAAQLVL